MHRAPSDWLFPMWFFTMWLFTMWQEIMFRKNIYTKLTFKSHLIGGSLKENRQLTLTIKNKKEKQKIEQERRIF
jgi:hypothetical protein